MAEIGYQSDQPVRPTELEKLLAFHRDERNIFHGYSKSSENEYKPRSVISRYFTERTGLLDILFKEVLKEEEHIPLAETIPHQYLAVFSTLLSIGKGKYLNRCIEHVGRM